MTTIKPLINKNQKRCCMEFFEVKVKRITVEGEQQKVLKESYCIQASSYTEAETRFAQFMEKNHAEDSFTVLKITCSKFSHLIKAGDDVEPGDPFFKVKILSFYQKEGSDKQRSHKILALIHAKDPVQAANAGDTLGDELSETKYEIIKIEKASLTGVIVMSKKSVEKASEKE